jgi:glyoxylate utilization-related uncharacterized protein
MGAELMPNTYIDSGALPRTSIIGAGEMTEVLNDALAGAKNVIATVHWLNPGDALHAGTAGYHHLVYLMDGEATISLNGAEHRVARGAGLYLGPAERARIAHAGQATLKLFHLTVPTL